MNTRGPWLLGAAVLLVVLFVGLVPRWRAPGPSYDVGPPGQAMVQFLPTETEHRDQTRPAPRLIPVADDARPALGAFRNVKVLTDLNAGDFMRVQQAMTAWVSPKQGCGFCHQGTDWASDAKPQKAAARVMLAMTRRINSGWRSHVGAQGVTCFSCHRGQPVPDNVWFQTPPRHKPQGTEPTDDWIESARTVHGFFPTEGYEEYLLQATPFHGQALTTLPARTAPSFPEVKRAYEAMMQMSDGMGVGCVYCHSSRNFSDWSQSTPMRWTGETGLQMTREIDRGFLLRVAGADPLTRWAPGSPRTLSLPARGQGAQIGSGLADCGTCHRGAPRPRDPAAGTVPGLTEPAAGSPPASSVRAAAPPPATPVRVAAAAPPPQAR